MFYYSREEQPRVLLLVSGIEFARNASTASPVKILPLETSYPLAALQSSDLAASRTHRKVCLFDLTFGKRCFDLQFLFFHFVFLVLVCLLLAMNLNSKCSSFLWKAVL